MVKICIANIHFATFSVCCSACEEQYKANCWRDTEHCGRNSELRSCHHISHNKIPQLRKTAQEMWYLLFKPKSKSDLWILNKDLNWQIFSLSDKFDWIRTYRCRKVVEMSYLVTQCGLSVWCVMSFCKAAFVIIHRDICTTVTVPLWLGTQARRISSCCLVC